MWGPFEASVAFDPGDATDGYVVAEETSADDGRTVSVFAVPVRFAPRSAVTLPGSSTDPVTTPDTPGGPDITAGLVDVRTGRHVGFDRVVFQFDDVMPGYTVRYVNPPITADPSDLPIDLTADGVLLVRMSAASGVDLSGPDARRIYTGPERLTPNYWAVHAVVRVGDFEGVLQWAINTWTRPPFRVFTLNAPPRLVIDVASAIPPN